MNSQTTNIGILTFWGVRNYGAFAQAYALNKIVKQLKTNCEVEHIAYLHPKHYDLYYKVKPPIFFRRRQLISPKFYLDIIKFCLLKNRRVENRKFKLDWDRIPNRVLKNEYELEGFHYGTIITGSDTIWEFSVPEFGDDRHLIGNDLNCDKLISYAASFGDMNLGDEFSDFVKNGLKKYNNISVRDDTSAAIVENLIGIEPKIVLDPTLLYNFQNDQNIPEPKYQNYILVYGHEFGDNLVSELKTYAEKNNMKIIGAGFAPEWCDIRLTNIGPMEWIGLFRNANLIVTCTFHGLMFSINYEKVVVFNQVNYVKNRSTYLLKKLGLYELFKNGTSLEKVLDFDWDYDSINNQIDKMRKESMNFLIEGLRDA